MEKLIPQIRVIQKDLPIEANAIYIVPLADLHIGDPGFDEELFLGYRRWILEQPNAYVVLPGDILDTPVRESQASDYWAMRLTPSAALDKAEELFAPLKERILGAVDGNHEYRAYLHTGISPLHILMERLNVSSLYAPEALVIKLYWGKDTSIGIKAYKLAEERGATPFHYNVYITHGWGGARKTGGQVNKAEELAAVVLNADIYIVAHEHTLFVSRWDAAVIPDRGGRQDVCKQQRKVFVGCGCFCQFTKYQARIQRRLPNLGAARIRLEGIGGHRGRKDCHISI